MAPAERATKRPLWIVVVALLLSAIALWVSSQLVWIEVPEGRTVDGRVSGDLTGSDLVSWQVPIALFSLAAIGGVLGARGWIRRVLGVLLFAVGAWALYLVFDGSAYDVAWSGWAPGYPEQGEPSRTLWGPATAAAAGVLVVLSGAMLVVRGHRMPRLGAKYSAPGEQKAAKDPDTELWDALSEGEDPTTRS
ncbi:hypothetical protein BAY61_23950 [Prauserella marina]|uniref:Trp region conserved hypothetical membrane protein n=1 Tax=Prauserella marina TaxID=530584 RepID=A0A222VUE4_9PSEU|nr:hypothetical protein BAY61_23950 [Prauserella marina]PWV75450.1 putative membrane protein (TIGR02234 family) [Prauserella marina]SDD34280.1 trp region conserved hypothetical membrane protein [Prauserella marina]